MSRPASDWAWTTPARGGDLLVLLALADWAHHKTQDCYPRLETIAERVGLSRRAVQKSIGWLDEVGLLEVRRGTGRGHPSAYLLNVGFQVPECCPDDAEECAACTLYDPSETFGTVHDLRPSEVPKDADDALFAQERVHRLQTKGAHGAPPIGTGHLTNYPPNPRRGKKRARQKTTDVRNDPDFQKFYDAFGVKKALPAAERMWLKALARPGVTAGMLIELATAYRARLTAEGKWPEYSTHPATWLNNERYLDEVPSNGQVADTIADPEEHLRDLWRKADAVSVARLAGAVWVSPSQEPGDRTPPEQWMRDARRQFITDHREAALVALVGAEKRRTV